MKILLIRFSSIGDIVLTSPIVRCLKAQMPEAEIHFLTKAEYRATVVHNPHIHRIHYFEDSLEPTIAELKKQGFDYVADLHRNLRSKRVTAALGVKRTHRFPKLNARKWVLANLRLNLMPEESIVVRYFEAVKPLGIRNDGQGLDFFIPKEAETAPEDIPFGHTAGFVACVIGGSYATKQLPVEQWRRFIEAVPYPVILLGGPEDRPDGQEIAEGFGLKVYNACGKFSLLESADLVRRSKVVVSNDTGLMHIAAAFRKPVVSLWGNTSPAFGMFPYYGFNNLETRVAPQSVILEKKGLYCHPCSKLGFGRCPHGHFRCMRALDMGAAVAAVKKLWTA